MPTKLLALASLLWSTCLLANGNLANIEIDGDTLTAEISLPGGFDADLTLDFEQALGLSIASVGLAAELVDPNDLSILRRLPAGEPVSIPQAFPVLLHIDPPATAGLSFAGVATVELHTHDLPYTAATPLRLFAASNGGRFFDISDSITSGSYRVRGTRGEFSEFIILTDLRAIADSIDEKFRRVTSTLQTHQAAIATGVYADLAADLGGAETAWDNGDEEIAIDLLDDFSRTVKSNSGANIPDIWRSSRDLTNVAGLLRARAATLRLSLTRAANSLP